MILHNKPVTVQYETCIGKSYVEMYIQNVYWDWDTETLFKKILLK